MLDATTTPHNTSANAARQQEPDFIESLVRSLESAFPSLKSFLSWEKELQSFGVIMAEV
jgi:hypothetical protein